MQIQDRTPDIVDRLITTRQVKRSSIAIQELIHAVGVLEPDDHRTPGVIAAIRGFIRSMPRHRVFAPDVDVLGRAALLSGIVCRLQGYAADHKPRVVNDCVLLLHAHKLGFTVSPPTSPISTSCCSCGRQPASVLSTEAGGLAKTLGLALIVGTGSDGCVGFRLRRRRSRHRWGTARVPVSSRQSGRRCGCQRRRHRTA
jgi:hypothetical protein